MTIQTSFVDGVVEIVAEGEVDLGKIEGMFTDLARRLGPDVEPRFLIYDEGTTFAPFTGELKAFMALFTGIFGDRHARIALVVKRDAGYGVARMLEARSEAMPFSARAFRPEEEDEAIAWIREGLDD